MMIGILLDSRMARRFRVVRDNRVMHNGNRDTKPAAKGSLSKHTRK